MKKAINNWIFMIAVYVIMDQLIFDVDSETALGSMLMNIGALMGYWMYPLMNGGSND